MKHLMCRDSNDYAYARELMWTNCGPAIESKQIEEFPSPNPLNLSITSMNGARNSFCGICLMTQ